MYYRISYLGAVLLIPFLLAFYLRLSPPKKIGFFDIIVNLIFYSMAIFLMILLPTSLIIKNIAISPTYQEAPGQLYFVFAVYFIAGIACSWIQLFRGFKDSSGVRRSQLKFLLFAILFAFISSFLAFVSILFSSKLSYINFYVFEVAYISMTAYAITKYELMDIRVIIGRGLAYGIVAVMLVTSFIYLNAIKMPVLISMTTNATLALIWAWAAHRLREFIQTPIDKWISWYKPEELLNSIALKLVSVKDRQEAFETITNELKNTIKIKNIDILTGDEIPKTNEIKRSGKNLEVPFSSTQGIEGALKLGEKTSEDPYGEKDLRFFQTLQVQLLAILDRVQAYETVKRNFEATQKKLYDAERLLARSEKIASLANVIREYNHEIKTPLSIIRGETGILAKKTRDLSYLEWFRDLVFEQVDRADDIVESTLRLSEPKERREIKLNLNDAIEDVLRPYHLPNINISRELSPLPEITGDLEDIKTVFGNLIKNAIEAMPDGGSIKVKTYSATEDDNPVVSAEISDSGTGIPEKNMEKIFEPFFSTHVTKGRGLGLSIVHRIVREHLGKIEVSSKVGSGSTFKVQFPVS